MPVTTELTQRRSPDTDYPDWGFLWFSSVHPGKYRYSTLDYVTTASFYILSDFLFINHLITRRYEVRDTDTFGK
jgi:hypothetical protein